MRDRLPLCKKRVYEIIKWFEWFKVDSPSEWKWTALQGVWFHFHSPFWVFWTVQIVTRPSNFSRMKFKLWTVQLNFFWPSTLVTFFDGYIDVGDGFWGRNVSVTSPAFKLCHPNPRSHDSNRVLENSSWALNKYGCVFQKSVLLMTRNNSNFGPESSNFGKNCISFSRFAYKG